MKSNQFKYKIISLAIAALILLFPAKSLAHCDGIDGPVVKDAKIALEKGDVKIVLKWVKKEHEKEITDLFNKTVLARKSGPDAKSLVDMHFFETLVRLHRAGEGAPYTGLKPAGTPIPESIKAADLAIEEANSKNLINFITKDISLSIEQKMNNVLEKKKHLNESVEAGREYVEAYVDFVHYIVRLSSASGNSGEGDEETEEIENETHHKH